MEKLQGPIGVHLNQSITKGSLISDCVDFEFDIKILSIKGNFCKSGTAEYTITAFGIQVAHATVDLAKGEVCNTVSVGVEEVQYCFYVRDNCLYSKGYVDGWLHEKQTWDEQIICI